jgi:hypothetical protein
MGIQCKPNVPVMRDGDSCAVLKDASEGWGQALQYLMSRCPRCEKSPSIQRQREATGPTDTVTWHPSLGCVAGCLCDKPYAGSAGEGGVFVRPGPGAYARGRERWRVRRRTRMGAVAGAPCDGRRHAAGVACEDRGSRLPHVPAAHISIHRQPNTQPMALPGCPARVQRSVAARAGAETQRRTAVLTGGRSRAPAPRTTPGTPLCCRRGRRTPCPSRPGVRCCGFRRTWHKRGACEGTPIPRRR